MFTCQPVSTVTASSVLEFRTIIAGEPVCSAIVYSPAGSTLPRTLKSNGTSALRVVCICANAGATPNTAAKATEANNFIEFFIFFLLLRYRGSFNPVALVKGNCCAIYPYQWNQ